MPIELTAGCTPWFENCCMNNRTVTPADMVRTVARSRRPSWADAAYDVRVRKWLIAAGVLVLAVAVAVTVWVITRSDIPTEYATPRGSGTSRLPR